jgi:hypothetical protein
MTPKAAQGGRATGTSFKGVFAYLQHDKRLEGEEVKFTSDRVEWQAFRNLATDNPDMAYRIMMATANQQDALKREAGQSAAGNKSDKVVFHYSLGWHPDEAAGLSKSEMLRAADESIRALGAEGHQAAIIAHNDTAHPHVHVVINRVDPENGKMLDLWKYQERLSKWAMAYEQERGKVWCDKRVENWKRRDLGETFSADRGAAYHHHDQAQALGHANDNDTRKIMAEQKAKDAALAAYGEKQHSRHSNEWKLLSQRYQAGKAHIQRRPAGERTPNQKAADDVRAQFKPLWSHLGKQQYGEMRDFERREKRISGKLENALAAVRHARTLNPDSSRGFMSSAFNFLINAKARADALRKLHAVQKRGLGAAQSAEIGAAINQVKNDQQAALKAHRRVFGSDRQVLIDKQAAERADLQRKWKTRKTERLRTFEIIRKGETLKKEAKAAPEASRGEQRAEFNRTAKAGRKRKGRVRKRER